jgi:hypothetical protein
MQYEKLVSRFWAKVDVSRGTDECWVWTAAITRAGYGITSTRLIGGERLAHRIAYFLVRGAIPEGLCICHQCDNPPCCNPNHLFVGTRAENRLDCVHKGRHIYGSAHYFTHLTDADVIEMRRLKFEDGLTANEIGKLYNLTEDGAWWIIVGKSWKHIPGGHYIHARRTRFYKGVRIKR